MSKMPTTAPIRVATAAAALFLLASPALSHSFDAVLVAPSAEQARDMATAFLIAAAERDGHADNHSDGHLGGLDVYLETLVLPEAAAPGTIAADFVVAPLAPAEGADLRGAAEAAGAVLVGPREIAAALPADLTPPEGLAPFAERFRAQTGHAPGPGATAAYTAARLIERAVRPQDGVDDRAALRAILSPDR